MSYSTSQIATGIATAKCCLGDYTDRLLRKASGGSEYGGTMYVTMEIRLLIFALEIDSTNDCLEGTDRNKMIDRINKLCQCDCTSSTGGGVTPTVGQHTVAEHTDLLHTE